MALVVSILSAASSFAQSPGPAGVALSDSAAKRHAVLLDAQLAGTWALSESAPLRLTDGLRLAQSAFPAPLDQGGGVDAETTQIVALLLGLIVGFGVGHLVARDQQGFILFLLVDVALVVAIVIFDVVVGSELLYGLGALGLVISHVIQGLSAYAAAGGPRIIERERRRTIELASAGEAGSPLLATRVLALEF